MNAKPLAVAAVVVAAASGGALLGLGFYLLWVA